MKKILKITTYLASAISLTLVVFLGGIWVKVTNREETRGDRMRGLRPLLGLGGVNYARADVPSIVSTGTDCDTDADADADTDC